MKQALVLVVLGILLASGCTTPEPNQDNGGNAKPEMEIDAGNDADETPAQQEIPQEIAEEEPLPEQPEIEVPAEEETAEPLQDTNGPVTPPKAVEEPAQPQENAVETVVPPQVTIYTAPNWTGESKTFIADTEDLNAFNDKAGSIRVAEGYAVAFYDNKGFTGLSRVFMEDTSDTGNARNNARSLKLLNLNSGKQYAILFDEENYKGISFIIEADNRNLSQIQFNDMASSLIIAEGYAVTLYENNGFYGTAREYTGNMPNLPAFNDSASSIKIWKE